MGGGLGGGVGATGGAGGLTLAHQSMAMARPSAGPPPGASSIPDAPGMAPPSSTAALAADLIDKHQQQLNLAHVRDVAKYPLVAIDLYATSDAIYVAGFSPKPSSSSSSSSVQSNDEEGDEPSGPPQAFLVGTIKDQVALKTTEQAHKTFRKWLSQDRTYHDLQTDVLALTTTTNTTTTPQKQSKKDAKTKNTTTTESAVVVQSPQQWLGIRRFSQAPESIKSKVTMEDEDELTMKKSPIAPETGSTQLGSIIMGHGSLDGTSVSQGDDYDRVVYKLKLCESKKALTVLPEEMTKVLFQAAQHDVARYYNMNINKNNNKMSDDMDVDAVSSYPCAVAVPAVNCNDNSIEALLEAMGGTGVIFQRSICALQGALMENYNQLPKQLLFVDHLQQTLAKIHKEHQLASIKNPDARLDESMLVLLTGMAQDCAEATAVQLSQPRPAGTSHDGIMWGDFKVLTNVSYRSPTPETVIDKCINELFDTLDTVAPEAGTPVAFLSYGSLTQQETIQTKWKSMQKSLENWEAVPSFASPPQAVALGTAFLGAVSHGRVSQIVQVPGKKPKADLAIHVHNVSPCAVGVIMNYHGATKDAPWTPVKTIFDFDRRVPAGPYSLDLVAAECVVYRENPTARETLSDEELVKAIQANQGAKYIPKREQAALDLRVQIMQKLTRDGEWQKVGNEMSPLVTLDKDEKKIACEKVVLELSLGTTGMITNAMTGER
jgi:hypothetical protein